MKAMFKNLLLFALNLFVYAVCWGVYWLCWACWWLAMKGTPAAGRWARDRALPRLGELLLALALDAVAIVVWLAWVLHDPRAAVTQTRERLIHAGASAAAWLVSLGVRAVAGAIYSGKCRRPVLCPVGVGLPVVVEQTDFADDLVPAVDPVSPSSPLAVADLTPDAGVAAVVQGTAATGSAGSAPSAEPVPALLAYHAALPAVPLLAYDAAVDQAVSAPANVEEPVVAPEPTRETEPPAEAEEPIGEEQPRPSLSRHGEVPVKADNVVAEALGLLAGGMSRRAAAKALGVAESTLRARLKRAGSIPVAA